MCANDGRIVVISALGGTFLRGPFKSILQLIPKCEKVKKLTAICKLCKKSASFTFRTADEEDKCLLGGADKYMPVCRECHYIQSNTRPKTAYAGDPTIINAKVELDDLTVIELNDGCALQMIPSKDKENLNNHSESSTANSTPIELKNQDGAEAKKKTLMAQVNDFASKEDLVEDQRKPLEISSTAAACE